MLTHVLPEKMNEAMIRTPKSDWNWRKVCQMVDLTPTQEATTSCAVKIGDSQIAIYHVPKRGLFASQQMCPHKRAFVLDHGIIGEDKNNNVYVSCPLHKRNFILDPNSKESSAGSPDVQKGSCSTDSGMHHALLCAVSNLQQTDLVTSSGLGSRLFDHHL